MGPDNLIAEWKLNQDVFRQMISSLGECSVDLFAPWLNAQLEKYVNWRPDLNVMETGALQLQRNKWTGYAFPSFCLIGRCFRRSVRTMCHWCW